MKKMMLIGAGVALLFVASVVAAVFVTRVLLPPPAVAEAEAEAEPEAAAATPAPVFYHHAQPEFVVNVPGSGRARFLMVELSIALDDEQALQVVEEHEPELRNDLLLMFGEQEIVSLTGSAGKERLRERAVEIVDALVGRHYAAGHVNDVFLTRFVIQ